MNFRCGSMTALGFYAKHVGKAPEGSLRSLRLTMSPKCQKRPFHGDQLIRVRSWHIASFAALQHHVRCWG